MPLGSLCTPWKHQKMGLKWVKEIFNFQVDQILQLLYLTGFELCDLWNFDILINWSIFYCQCYYLSLFLLFLLRRSYNSFLFYIIFEVSEVFWCFPGGINVFRWVKNIESTVKGLDNKKPTYYNSIVKKNSSFENFLKSNKHQ